jgi:hypothetical protein
MNEYVEQITKESKECTDVALLDLILKILKKGRE